MKQLISRNPLIKLFSTAVIDQVILSAANFLVAMAIIRYSPMADYGYFVLAQATIALVNAAQGSLLGGLFLLGPKREPHVRDAMLCAAGVLRSRIVNRLFPIAVPIPALLYTFEFIDLLHMGIWTAIIVSSWLSLARSFSRSCLLVQARPQELLVADIIYVIILVGGVTLSFLLPGHTAVWAIAFIALASSGGAIYAYHRLNLSAAAAEGGYPQLWSELKKVGVWTSIGSVVHWVQAQSFNYILAARLAVEAVAHVNAARMLMMPAFLLNNGVSPLLVPSAAGWLHHDGLRRLLRRLSIFFVVILVLDICYFVFLWFSRDLITGDILQKVIEDRDLLILLWAGIGGLELLRSMSETAVLAMEKVKVLAFLSGLAAIITLGTTWFCISWIGAPGTVIGVAIGEIVYLIGIAIVLVASLRELDDSPRSTHTGN